MFLSIIIPVYNGAKYISRCLNSIWSQGLDDDDFEVICVDDCSTDDSYEVLCELARLRANFVVLQNSKNRHAGGSRNHGVGVARGEYILFIDSDDYFDTNAIVSSINYLKKTTLDILVCDFARHSISNPNNKLVHNFSSKEIMSGQDFLITNTLPWAPWKYIFRHELMVNNNCWFEEYVRCQDVDWTHKLAFYANKMQYQPILLTHYILNEESVTAYEYKNTKAIWHRLFSGTRVYELKSLYNESPIAIDRLNCVSKAIFMEGAKALLCAYLPIKDKVDMIVKYIPNDPALGREVAIIRRFPRLFAIGSNLASPFIYTAIRLKRRLRGR